jgi:hypothetical protein
MFVIANVIGLIPMAYLFPTIPLFWLVPGLEFGWGVFTLLQFHAKGYSEFMGYRFIIGLFEAPYCETSFHIIIASDTDSIHLTDSCVHFALGSWYRSDELARRGGIFQAAINLGTLTAGLLQSASSKNLSGVNGLSGWRWNFIITAIVPLTLAPIGFFIWPGTPDKPNRRVISETDIAVAKTRLKSAGVQVEPVPFSIPLLKHAFSHKKIYILVGWLTIVFNCSFANGAFLLWVKSLKRFSIPKINNLGTIPSVVSIFVTPATSFAADLAVGRTAAFVFIAALNFTALVIMAVYEVPEAAKWFSLSLSAMTNALIPLIYSWANTLMRHDAKERAITLTLMQIVATSTNAWVPLLVWPTVESPKFRKGYPYAAVMTFVAIIVALCVRYIYRKEEYVHSNVPHGEWVITNIPEPSWTINAAIRAKRFRN